MKEKFYEKYAWVIFLIIGILILTGGIPHMFGTNTDPELVTSIAGQTIAEIKESNPLLFNLYDFYFKGGGLSDIGVAFFLIVISINAYRKGDRWSWFALWFVPVFFSLWIIVGLSLPREAQSSLQPPLMVFIALSVSGLLLPVRKFFPRK